MVECSNQLPAGSGDKIPPNDVISQIMGKDKPSHERMMGKGICPTDVWNETPRSTSNLLLIEYKEKKFTTKSNACNTTKTSCFTSRHKTRCDKGVKLLLFTRD